MGKAFGLLFVLAWLAGWAEAGFLMTRESFAWVDKPNFGLPVAEGRPSVPRIDIEKVKAAGPKPGQDTGEWFASLSETKKSCVFEAVGTDRATALIAGAKPTTEETLRLLECLQ